MNFAQRQFDIFPTVVPADTPVELTVVPRPGGSLKKLGDFELYYRAHNGLLPDGAITPDIVPHPAPEWKFEGNRLKIRGVFSGEQEHSLDLIVPGSAQKRPQVLHPFRIYSLRPDWIGLIPFRGNFHQHTANSRCCHAKEDTPAHVVAESRAIGLDFTVLSDHSYYDSSREAAEEYRAFPLPIRVFPGEEVHPLQWSCHVVNFGGSRSITREIESDKERFFREVKAIQQDFSGTPPHMETFVPAAAEWAFEKIRACGGIAIYAHPCWYYDALAGLMVAPEVVSLLLHRKKFDALEVVSGFKFDISEYNNRQLIRYFEEVAVGNRIPLVGSNDSHSCAGADSEFDWYSTILLSRDLSLESIRTSLMEFRSAAVEALPGVPAKAYCDSRLLNYVLFLLREFFPRHDALCRAEGELLRNHSVPGAREKLAAFEAELDRWKASFLKGLES